MAAPTVVYLVVHLHDKNTYFFGNCIKLLLGSFASLCSITLEPKRSSFPRRHKTGESAKTQLSSLPAKGTSMCLRIYESGAVKFTKWNKTSVFHPKMLWHSFFLGIRLHIIIVIRYLLSSKVASCNHLNEIDRLFTSNAARFPWKMRNEACYNVPRAEQPIYIKNPFSVLQYNLV